MREFSARLKPNSFGSEHTNRSSGQANPCYNIIAAVGWWPSDGCQQWSAFVLQLVGINHLPFRRNVHILISGGSE